MNLLLLSQKDDTHFTVPWRVEGWVDIVGWLNSSDGSHYDKMSSLYNIMMAVDWLLEQSKVNAVSVAEPTMSRTDGEINLCSMCVMTK